MYFLKAVTVLKHKSEAFSIFCIAVLQMTDALTS